MTRRDTPVIFDSNQKPLAVIRPYKWGSYSRCLGCNQHHTLKFVAHFSRSAKTGDFTGDAAYFHAMNCAEKWLKEQNK